MTPSSSTARQNTVAAAIVDNGIALLQISDRDRVAAFLLTQGIRFPVIIRVLSDSRSRRRADRSEASIALKAAEIGI